MPANLIHNYTKNDQLQYCICYYINQVWYPHSWSSVIDIMMLELYSLCCDLPTMSYLRLEGHTGPIHWVLPLLMRHQACKQMHNFCLQLLLIAARCFLCIHNSGYLHLPKLKCTDIKYNRKVGIVAMCVWIMNSLPSN